MPYTTSGIQINSRFVQNAAIPLDNRYTCANAAQRATIPAGVLYNGLQVWLEDVKQLTVWDGSAWITLSGGGISSLNGLTAATQTFATGTAGTDFNIASSGSVHTFNIPNASATARGVVNTGTQAFAGSKSFNNSFYISNGATPVSGAGTRFMWIPSKAALRAGSVDGTQWNNANIGQYSMALGYNCRASGSSSLAFGEECIASGYGAIAFSGGTASGSSSFALGYDSVASGSSAVAFGNNSVASGSSAVAFGNNSVASGSSAVAFVNSQALGNNSVAFVGSTASGNASVAFVGSTASDSSIAFLNSTALSGSIAFVQSTASGDTSIAFVNSTALGYQSMAFVDSTASANYAIALGSSTASGTTSFAVGSSVASGANAVALSLGQATGVISFCFGNQSVSSGTYSLSFGNFCIASGVHSFAKGFFVVSRDRYTTSFGQYNEDVTNDATFFSTDNVALGIGNGTSTSDRRNAFRMTFGGQTYINNTGAAITQTASSILDLRSTTKGFLAPRMTTTERNAISSPATGLLIYNTSDNAFNFYNGTSWANFSSGGGITSLNGLTGATQTFATGTSGTDFNISSSGSVHTFNIPDASATARGLITNGAQTIAGNKTFSGLILGANGSNSSPSFSFSSDTNTGIYNIAPDIIGITTNGVERLRINSTGNFAFNSTDTTERFHVSNVSAGDTIGLPIALFTGLGNSHVVIQSASNTDGRRPEILVRRSRGTVNSPTAVVLNDKIGGIGCQGYSGTTYLNAAIVEAYVDGTVTSTEVPMRLSFTTGTNPSTRAERLTVKFNGQIGVNNTSPNSSCQFQIDSTTRGFLTPRMTTTQRNAITAPATGLMIYNTTTNKLECFDGTTWQALF